MRDEVGIQLLFVGTDGAGTGDVVTIDGVVTADACVLGQHVGRGAPVSIHLEVPTHPGLRLLAVELLMRWALAEHVVRVEERDGRAGRQVALAAGGSTLYLDVTTVTART